MRAVKTFNECWERGVDDISVFARDFLDVDAHPGQVEWWNRKEKPEAVECALATSNRWGKTFSVGVKLLHHAFYQIRPEKYVYDKLGRFRPYRAINIALSLDQAMIAWTEASRLAQNAPRFRPFFVKQVGAPFPAIEISNRGKGSDRTISEVWARSTAKRAKFLLGKNFNFLNYDEAAFDVDGEIILDQVLRMRMADEAGNIDFTSSPNGKNWFYKQFALGQDPRNQENYSRSGIVWENPNVDHARVRRNMQRMSPDWVKQNILGEFADYSNIFSAVHIGNCTRDQDYMQLLPVPYNYEVAYTGDEEGSDGVVAKLVKCSRPQRYVIGADLAVKRDKTVIIVLRLGENGAAHQLVALEEMSRTNWKAVYAAIQKWSNMYGGCRALIDSTANSSALERLQDLGVNVEGYNFAGGEQKTNLVLTGQEALQNTAVRFPHIPELVNQLIYYEWADKNLDTDYVFGFCLALEAAKNAQSTGAGITTTESGIYVVRGGGENRYIIGDGLTPLDDEDYSTLAEAMV
jgi:hypothetical protein